MIPNVFEPTGSKSNSQGPAFWKWFPINNSRTTAARNFKLTGWLLMMNRWTFVFEAQRVKGQAHSDPQFENSFLSITKTNCKQDLQTWRLEMMGRWTWLFRLGPEGQRWNSQGPALCKWFQINNSVTTQVKRIVGHDELTNCSFF